GSGGGDARGVEHSALLVDDTRTHTGAPDVNPDRRHQAPIDYEVGPSRAEPDHRGAPRAVASSARDENRACGCRPPVPTGPRAQPAKTPTVGSRVPRSAPRRPHVRLGTPPPRR